MKKGTIATLVGLVAVGVLAEPIRPQYTKENRMPAHRGAEVSAEFRYTDLLDWGGRERYELAARGRYGLLDNLAVFARVPMVRVEPNFGSDTQGLGDVSAGFECVVYEDIFDYPWIMPHAEVIFSTGDEDDGLGEGSTIVIAGIAVGTTVKNVYHFNLDARYRMQSNAENMASAALSVIWDISKDFSVLVEGVLMEDRDDAFSRGRTSSLIHGGMVYRATERLEIGVYGGGGNNVVEDALGSLRLSLLF